MAAREAQQQLEEPLIVNQNTVPPLRLLGIV